MFKNFYFALTALFFLLFTANASAKTLVYCSEGSPEGFNPVFYTSGTTFDATSRPLYNRLLAFKPGTTEIVPSLAERWEVSEDGLTYTFYLRRQVSFHANKYFKPTRYFNADDVIFSFERQLDPDHPYHDVSDGSYVYFDSMGMNELIKNIEKVNDYTVRFHLIRPDAPMIANLAMDFASIFSAEYADKMMELGTPEYIDIYPVGTGPFRFVNYQKDAFIRYIANKKYWDGVSKIDRLVFSITPDAAVRYAKLNAGECHVMPYPNPADVENMKKNPDINLLSKEGLNIGYLAFNTSKRPFNDVDVRKALSMAVDKEAILQAIYMGAGKKAVNPIPPTIWSYNDDVRDYPYDPAQAKKLLKKAGFEDGFKTTIWAMPVQRPYNPNARRMAEMIQADWKKVGVDAKIVSYEWGEYLNRLKKGEHDTAMAGWTGDNGDPDNFLAVLLGCQSSSNYSSWCNKDFDGQIMQAKKTSDMAKRTRLYRKAQEIFKREAPWLTIAHSIVYMPVRKEVKNYKVSPFGLHDFYGVDLVEE